MRQYELTYLISDNVPENDLNKVTGKVGGYISECNGKILKEEIWGRRKLAYPIQKQEFATYVTVNFEMPAENVKEFEHDIKMTGKIVRHLMILKEIKEEELKLTKEELTETEEIEEALGGEKSFEAVEGETEESKDLMAVRGENKDEDEEEKKETEEVKEENKNSGKEGKETKVTEKEKTAAKKQSKKTENKKDDKNVEDEVERLSKLNEELDDILKDDL